MAELSFHLQVHNHEVAEELNLHLPAQVLPQRRDVPCMPALRHLTLRFNGAAELAFLWCPALPALRTLWLANMQLELNHELMWSDFSSFSEGGLEFAM